MGLSARPRRTKVRNIREFMLVMVSIDEVNRFVIY